MPWHHTFDSKGYTDYLKSRQPGQQGQPASGEIDWEGDFEAAKKGHTHVSQRIAALEKNLEERSQQVLELFGLLRQADDLDREDLHTHLGRGGFKQELTSRDVVQYAMERGIADLRAAMQQLLQER